MNETYRGDNLTFWELINRQKVEIPIIQRDYAQGREDKKEIRSDFLKALYSSICDEKPIMLDFVYGSIEDSIFQPLDGQQRLTTLFLLHWYAAVQSNCLDKEITSKLKKFSYETRISSREFCKSLVSNEVSLTKDKALSSHIVDSAWFFLSWKKDPTIDAMLRSIDDIHYLFHEVNNLWVKLTSEKKLIGFYHVDLENIGLTDDLYIKMNARGKLLSPFENFKASFQKYINDNKWDADKEFVDSFAYKIDSIWTDTFWENRIENRIDYSFIRFISTILMIRQTINKSEDRLTIISRLQDNPNTIKPNLFNESDFDYLCNCFDIYYHLHKDDIDVNLVFPVFQHKPDKTIFSAIVYESHNPTYSHKVLFFAQTEYLSKITSFNLEKFQDWMRVIRNIISRGDVTKNGKRPTVIRSPQTFDGVIKLIRELSQGCENIYEYLSSDVKIRSTFTKEQVEEERLKSKLIVKNPLFKEAIFNAEDTNLLLGRVDFALFCIDYDGNGNFNVDLLTKVNKILNRYFDKDSDINNDLRRALLTISDDDGNYKYYEYWWSFWNVVSANKRCLIDKLRELEFYIYGNYKYRDQYKIYLKKLILKLIDNDLQKIVSDFDPPDDMPNWKIRLIKEPQLLNINGKSNYIAIPDDNSCCYLLKSVRPRDIDGCEIIK